MDGLTVSFITLIVTILISFLVAFIVKLMTVLLDKFSKPHKETNEAADTLVFSDESDIAAIIAIAKSQK